jgi:biotin operon repressor
MSPLASPGPPGDDLTTCRRAVSQRPSQRAAEGGVAVEIVLTPDGAIAEVSLAHNGTLPLRIQATGIRRERTGTHATIYIYLQDRCLAWSHFNLERDEERTRLARKAHRLLSELNREMLPEQHLVHYVDTFCRQLWPAHLQRYSAELLSPESGPPADPILDPPLLVEGGGTILYGPPGRGKSYTALAIAIAVDAGVAVGPLTPLRPGRALYINLERYRTSIARRLHALNCALGLPPNRPMLVINARGRTLLDLAPAIEMTIRQHRISLLVLDSLSRAGMGSLVEDMSANRVMDMLNSWEVTWLAIAHTPRADSSHVYGSIMLDAAADICIQAITQTADGRLGVGLKVTKANDIAMSSFPVLCYEFSRDGVLTAIRAAHSREFADIDRERPLRLPEQLLELLHDQGPMSAEEAAAALGCSRSYVAETMSSLERQGQLTSFRSGRRTMYAVRQTDGHEEELM